ncbi:MAG TPA: CofH family radical SAM protein [Phycisphaerales bacterium]|nr:CofH family radical SAM protein [Phycisphaerales bacterium]
MATLITPPSPSSRPAPRPGHDPRLDDVADKVEGGTRLTPEDGLALYRTPDLWRVCELADTVRRRRHGDVAYYNINRHLNYSNVCALSCSFCDFYAKRGEAKAYTRDMDYVREQARLAVAAGATEIHSVGGLHPYLPFEYYTDLVRTIRETARGLGSDLHVKAFTAVEIVHLARIARVYRGSDPAAGIRWVLERLIEAGLGSLPGGGAEVFDDRVHDEAFRGKIRSDVWLEVHRVAHELGLCTNATILYGHIEDARERLVHMDLLRRAQDAALERGGGGRFQTIIPLPFIPDGSGLGHLAGPGGLENLRTLAVARLMLDNFAHVKAFWIMQTLPMAQLMLGCGADDLDGTVVWYDITKLPGAAPGGPDGAGPEAPATHQEVSVFALRRAIREAGFRPVERDTLYRPVRREGQRWWVQADGP